jgi:hypothetical protein
MSTPAVPRRTFLRGLGTAIALPFLDAMAMPFRGLAAGPPAVGHLPRRMAFIYIPNGANMADWTPRTVGPDFELPPILEPLQPVKEQLLVLSGLAHDKARPNGDGAGDHARASATFLTGCQARKTAGADIKVGVSVDQVAAARLGPLTRLPSIELGCDKAHLAGNCDSGYSCAYSFNISWRTDAAPNPPEANPRSVFERLFAGGTRAEREEGQTRRRLQQKSILDFALEDAAQLQGRLGATDRRKLDEYLTAVRELEQRIEREEKFAAVRPDLAPPAGIPKEYEKHLRLMFDLLALAFQTDTTRIATFMLAHDGSNRPYPFIGVTEGHHDLSHHGGDAAKKQKITKVNRFHATQFAYFLERLNATKEGEGSLLDHCMIVYGGAIGDGNAHNHDNLPVLLAGRGGGTIQPGRHVRVAKETPMTNLYLSMLERMGVAVDRIGDSTGRLEQLA